jgi:hypothetical protein
MARMACMGVHGLAFFTAARSAAARFRVKPLKVDAVVGLHDAPIHESFCTARWPEDQ